MSTQQWRLRSSAHSIDTVVTLAIADQAALKKMPGLLYGLGAKVGDYMIGMNMKAERDASSGNVRVAVFFVRSPASAGAPVPAEIESAWEILVACPTFVLAPVLGALDQEFVEPKSDYHFDVVLLC